MTEFMYHYWQEVFTSRITEVIGVEDAATTIVLCIHEDDDMLIWRTCQQIMQLLEVQGG